MVNRIQQCGLLSFLFFGILACQSTIADRYSEDELVNIMFDAHTLGLIYNRQEERTDSLKDAYYEVLEQRYGLDREEFQRLMDGLILDAELYDRVYDRMVRQAEQMEQRNMQGL